MNPSQLPPKLESISLDQPSRIIFGVGASNELAKEISQLVPGNAKVFLVHDRFLTKSDVLPKIVNSLNEKGMGVQTYEVAAEPTIETVSKMVESMRQGQFGCVVGIGGGSSLDTAKFASLLYANKGGVEDYLTSDPIRIEKPLPKILMPTTAGTGSEVSSFAVAIGKDRVKRFLQGQVALADVALIDPTLALTCPKNVTAGSGMDALGTAIEAVLSKKATMLSDFLATSTIQLVAKNLRKAVTNGDDIPARYNMAMAAMFSGLAVNTPAAVNISHCIAEVIGPMYRIPHGETVGITTPYGMEFNAPACEDGLVKIAEAIGLQNQGLASGQVAKSSVEAVRQLCADIGIPSSFVGLGLSEQKLDEIANYIVSKQISAYGLSEINPVELGLDNVKMLLKRMCS